jgi:hypothetical protein
MALMCSRRSPNPIQADSWASVPAYCRRTLPSRSNSNRPAIWIRPIGRSSWSSYRPSKRSSPTFDEDLGKSISAANWTAGGIAGFTGRPRCATGFWSSISIHIAVLLLLNAIARSDGGHSSSSPCFLLRVCYGYRYGYLSSNINVVTGVTGIFLEFCYGNFLRGVRVTGPNA